MTRRSVTDEQFGLLTRRTDELKRRVDEGTLPFTWAMEALQRSIEDKWGGIPVWAIPPATQIGCALLRSDDRGWGFTKKDFAVLDLPRWPDGKLCAAVLDVQLDTVQQTFEEAWHFASSAYPNSWQHGQIKSDSDNLRLLSGMKHKRGLSWQLIDLGDRRNWTPQVVRSPETSPASAILWAASYFPAWVQAMDGEAVPYVFLPGYELFMPLDAEWSFSPYLSWEQKECSVDLRALYMGSHSLRSAVPTLIDQL